MKKLIAKIVGAATAFAMAIGVVVAVSNNREATRLSADDSSFTISLKDKALANATSYQTNQTTTNYNGGDATATLEWSNLNPNSGQVKGNQSTQNNNFWIYNSVALSGNIRSITLSGISGTYTANKVYAATSASAALSTRATNSSTAGTNGSSSVTWSFAGTSGGYFAVFATNGFTTGSVYATAITITYAPSGEIPSSYTVTYDANGGSGEMTDPNSPYNPNATVTTLTNTFTRSGYVFSGWNTRANGSGASYIEGATFSIGANTILYAQWTQVFTVAYDANGGSGEMTDPNSPYTSGSNVTIMSNSFTYTDYVFDHWNTSEDDTGQNYNPGQTINSISANTTLYAQWRLVDLAGHTGTINFGSANGAINVDSTSVSGADNLKTSWTVSTVAGDGGESFTSNPSYAQIGSSAKPAASITINSGDLGDDYKVTALSAKFGGFNGTGGTVTLKVDETTVGTGTIAGDSDVIVSNTSVTIGSTLTVTVTGIAKGIKIYYISYTLAPEIEDQIITADNESAYDDEEITVSSTALTPVTWSIVSGAGTTADNPVVTSGGVVSVDGPGTVTVKAVALGYNDATKQVTFNERPAGNFYTVSFDSNGGSNSPSDITNVPEGTKITFPSAGDKDHYSFDGWTSTGSAPYHAAGTQSDEITSDTTFTAHWTEDAKYVVEYNSDTNGTGSYLTEEYGGTYALLPYASISGDVTPNSGYRFKDYTVGGVHKNPGDTITLSDDTEITVNFEERPQAYEIYFGSTKDTNPDPINTEETFKETYDFYNAGNVAISNLNKIYGESTTMLKLGSNKATASITFTIPSSYYITSVVVEIDTVGGASLNVTSGASEAETENQAIAVGTLTFDDYLESERNNSVTLESTAAGAFYVTSIVINYETFRHDVESLDTQTMLSYRYEDNGSGGFTITDLSIRFGAVISKNLWNELDTTGHLITGFGVMITTLDVVHEYQNIKDFAEYAEPAASSPDINNDIIDYYMPLSSRMPPEDGDDYAWNLFYRVDWEDRDVSYIAAPYIKLGDEYVFFEQEHYSVISLALDYLANRGCNSSTADGSLSWITTQTSME